MQSKLGKSAHWLPCSLWFEGLRLDLASAMDQLRVFVPAVPRGASTQPALPAKPVQPGVSQPGPALPGVPHQPGLQSNMQAVFVQRCVQGQLQQLAPVMYDRVPGSPQKPRWMEAPLAGPGKEAKPASPSPVRPSPDTIVKQTHPVHAGPIPDSMRPSSSASADTGRLSTCSAPLTDSFVKASSPVPTAEAVKPSCSEAVSDDIAPGAPSTCKPLLDVECKSWATSTFSAEYGARDFKDPEPLQEVKDTRSPSPDVSKPAARLLEVPGRDGRATSPKQALTDASRSPSCRTVGSDTSSIRDDLSGEEVYSRTASPEPTRQSGKQQLAELLELWKTTRHESGPLSIEECDCIENIFYDTMNPDRVKIVEMRRVVQPALLRRFCTEEQDSMERQARQLKTHKQFMLLHGTRWEYAPLIAENGLDPSCGHLTKGSWLGGLAVKAHSYASKGPGPEVEEDDGHKARLFALFVVSCVPDVNDGDDERSFGVWRMMSARRMCPAYQVIYSAPADVGRHKRPLIEPRANKATLLRKQSHDGTGTESAGPSSFRCRSVSPPPRSRSPNPDAFAEVTGSWPLPEGRGLGACTSPALKARIHVSHNLNSFKELMIQGLNRGLLQTVGGIPGTLGALVIAHVNLREHHWSCSLATCAC